MSKIERSAKSAASLFFKEGKLDELKASLNTKFDYVVGDKYGIDKSSMSKIIKKEIGLPDRAAKEIIDDDSNEYRVYGDFLDIRLSGVDDHRSSYARTMISLKELELLPSILAREVQPTDIMASWATVLPCSMEIPEFMELHHASIFDPKFAQYSLSESEALIEGFNSNGSLARMRYMDRTRRAQNPMYCLMFEDDLRLISDMNSDEFFRCGRDIRRNQINQLRDIVKFPDVYQSKIVLISAKECEMLFNDVPYWKPGKRRWDSIVVIRDVVGNPKLVFSRTVPNAELSVSMDSDDLMHMNGFLLEVENLIEPPEYTLTVLDDMLKRIELERPE